MGGRRCWLGCRWVSVEAEINLRIIPRRHARWRMASTTSGDHTVLSSDRMNGEKLS